MLAGGIGPEGHRAAQMRGPRRLIWRSGARLGAATPYIWVQTRRASSQPSQQQQHRANIKGGLVDILAQAGAPQKPSNLDWPPSQHKQASETQCWQFESQSG